MLSVGHIQGLDQLHYQAQLPEQNLGQISAMDDLMEMIGLSSWPDTNAMNKFPWDQNIQNNDSCVSTTSNASSSINSGGHNTNTDLLSQSFLFNPTQKINYNHNLSSDDILAASAQQQQGLHDALIGSISATTDGLFSLAEAPQNVLPRMQEGVYRLPSVTEISQHVQPPFSNSPQTWHHIYMSGTSSSSPMPSPLRFGHFSVTTNESFNARRPASNESHEVGPNAMFIPQVCGSQLRPPAPQPQVPLQTVQIPNGVSGSHYPASTHTGLGQPQGAAAVVAGTARPRVRARRGQATDPHSIAERLRRERIAERMKALQELVPNANKTDKASMLDEVIEYVRFLQLQVKVLSMSRISGSSAIAPMVADVSSEGLLNFNNNSNNTNSSLRGPGTQSPSQDNMVVTEQQVAKLMEESMGSAMQFLQSKGLCLMPISLASTMSSNNKGGMRTTSTSSSQNKMVVWQQSTSAAIGRLSSNAPSTNTTTTTTSSSSVSANATTTITTMTMPTSFGGVVADQANSVMNPVQSSTTQSLSAANSADETA